jgi:hypothetical protein
MAPIAPARVLRSFPGQHSQSAPGAKSHQSCSPRSKRWSKRRSKVQHTFLQSSVTFDIKQGVITFRKLATIPKYPYITRSTIPIPQAKTWEHIFKVALVFDLICRSLEPSSITALQQTCRTIYGLLQDVIQRQWSINYHLQQYVVNPIALRSQIALCNALISGSVALQFFNRSVWEDSTLDIFVYKGGHNMDRISQHLIIQEGYILIDSTATSLRGDLNMVS